MTEKLTPEELAAIRGRHERMLRDHGGQFHPIGTLAVYRDRAALLRHVEALEQEVERLRGIERQYTLLVTAPDTIERKLARLREDMTEIAEALCVPFPDLASKAEIIDQVKQHLESLDTSAMESERKLARRELVLNDISRAAIIYVRDSYPPEPKHDRARFEALRNALIAGGYADQVNEWQATGEGK